MDRLLHENPDKYKCFLKDNEVRFELKIGGNTLSYTLSGHPYAPTFIAKCDDEIYSYSEEGRLWLPDVDSDWSGFCEELADELEKNYYLKHKTFDEKILGYKESDKDKHLSKIAELIIGAYNGSYKPPIIQAGVPMYVKHTPEGYSLITSDRGDRIETTDEYFSDFVEHVFLVLAGNTEVKWKWICESDAVTHALEKYFGIKVDLSYTGYYAALKSDVATHPTIWAAVDLKANPDAWTTMEEKGFDYFDRNIWMIEL